MNAIYFYFFFILVHPIFSQWWKVFAKAERKSWEAFIPIYNYCVASKIGGQPFWYGLLMAFPGIHLFMYFVFNLALQRRFGYYGLAETAIAIFFPWLQYAKIASDDSITMLEPMDWNDENQVKRRAAGDHLTLFLSLPVFGHLLALIVGSIFKPAKGKTPIKDWGETILFALIAASIIRTYVFEPFKIPTGSMEKTLLIGDFLFVNKLAYGPKVPNTPLSFPLFHNNIPFLDIPSYSTLEKVSYYRLPGWTKVNRYDVVVFNYPSGDTAVYDPRMPMGLMGHDYHGIVLNEARRLYFQSKNVKENEYLGDYFRRDYNKAVSAQFDKKTIDSLSKIEGLTVDEVFVLFEKSFYSEFLDNLEYWKNQARYEIAVIKRTYSRGEGIFIEHKGLIPRPVDKRENYIKRCVGIPGDTLEIINTQLYVNGEKAPIFSGQNLGYIADGLPRITAEQMEERFGLVIGNDYGQNSLGQYIFFITKSEKEQLMKAYPEATFKLMGIGETQTQLSEYEQKMDNLNYYPKSPLVQNTTENFQKFWVPKKGATIPLTKENIIWYGRVITAYEGRTLEEKNGKVFIDGKEASSYTFGLNYYWMMGDNRYNSADSRVWGFVPEDHIVGRAAIVWLSTDQRGTFPMNIRWKRVFTKIK